MTVHVCMFCFTVHTKATHADHDPGDEDDGEDKAVVRYLQKKEDKDARD